MRGLAHETGAYLTAAIRLGVLRQRVTAPLPSSRAMTLPPLTYLATDSVAEGVGASQILPYVERLGRQGLEVVLHTYEKLPPTAALTLRLAAAGVRWHPHQFGRHGAIGGLARVLRGAVFLRRAELVHARSDLAAASALLARVPTWVWDVRSFWTDQRIDLGVLRPGSVEERVLRAVEHRAASSCEAIITLARSAVPVLEQRHGKEAAVKSRVITTCVELDRFQPSSMPPFPPVRVLLSGTLNTYYDVSTMTRLADRWRQRRATDLIVLTPSATPWDALLVKAGARRSSASPEEMPAHIAAAHVGLSVCRTDAGVSIRAAMPTKLGEFLASGRPVVVNKGLGDMDEIIADHNCGVIVSDTSDQGLDDVIERLEEVLSDPETPDRCRDAAERHFDLDRAVDDLVALYRDACGIAP
jgi:glycosyltransferase involved in cell wall biosynthesis